jgi:CRP-like cAMP-binding protein
MLDRAHSRTAIALSDLHLLKLPADAWVELLEDSFELLRVAILHATHLVALLDEQLGDTAPGKQDSPVLELPTRPLSVIERLAVFVDLPLLSRAGVQTLVDLAIEAEEVRYEPGHVVLERGAPRDRGVLVLEGIVSATRDAPDLSRRFGPGSMVCGAAAFGPTSTAWRAVAITEVRALSITAESWFDLLEEHFDIAKSVLAGRALERERLLDQLATRDPGVVFAH